MKKYGFSVWLVRLIFCICVIIAYNVIGNVGFILTWFSRLFKVLTPFIVGGVIAFLLFPICKKLENLLILTKNRFILGRRREFAVLVVVFVMFILILSVLLIMIPMLYRGLVNFSKTFPENIEKFYTTCKTFSKDNGLLNDIVDNVAENLNRSYGDIATFLTSLNYKNYVGGLASIFLKIFNFFIGLIISIYILIERKTLKFTLIRVASLILNEGKVARVRRLFKKISKIIYIFIFGQILDALIVAYMIGLTLTLFRINNSVILAAFYFILAIIPYFGSIVGVVFISIFSLFLGDVNQFFIATVVALILQQVDANFINPKIVGQAVGIKPLYVILGITLFGGIFGVWGLFLGPPLMAICLELLEAFVKSKESKKEFLISLKTSVTEFSKRGEREDDDEN